MGIPKVKVACVSAVMQKAMHTGTMGEWTVDWLQAFCKEQPALATHMCAWIERLGNDNVNEGILTSMTAMVGIMVKSIESQIECDELLEELG